MSGPTFSLDDGPLVEVVLIQSRRVGRAGGLTETVLEILKFEVFRYDIGAMLALEHRRSR